MVIGTSGGDCATWWLPGAQTLIQSPRAPKLLQIGAADIERRLSIIVQNGDIGCDRGVVETAVVRQTLPCVVKILKPGLVVTLPSLRQLPAQHRPGFRCRHSAIAVVTGTPNQEFHNAVGQLPLGDIGRVVCRLSRMRKSRPIGRDIGYNPHCVTRCGGRPMRGWDARSEALLHHPLGHDPTKPGSESASTAPPFVRRGALHQSIDAAEAAFEAANLTIWLPAQSDAIEFRCSAPR